MSLRLAALLIFTCSLTTRAAELAPVKFSRDVLPILSDRCFYCHGPDEKNRKGDRRLDTLEGATALNDGVRAIIPGKLGESELIARILSTDPEEIMPPPKAHKELTPTQIETLKRWVAEGAQWGKHWAFEKIERPVVPKIEGATNPIDAFVRARLQREGLQPSPEAPRETLIRRLSLDLTGLPPSPEEVDAFLADTAPGAYERVADRLLASPHYGERMALPWLDAARYADSNGFQQDGDTFQWVWRDWVVKALNDNMPFDQFTIEQFAGDLLPNSTTEQKLATGFNRNHMLNGEGGAIAEEQRHVVLFDRVDTTATNWLGLTMACAQCHDHKFDPVTQRDYYAMIAAFNNLPESGTPAFFSSKIRLAEPLLDVASPEQKAKLNEMETRLAALKKELKSEEREKEWETKIAADEGFADKEVRETAQQPVKERKRDKADKLHKYFLEKELPKLEPKLAKDIADLEGRVKAYKNEEYPRVMVMAETKPRETFILDRGNYEMRKDKVAIATPAFLPAMPDDAPRNRLGIARWLVSAEQPLTPRVIVNRHWQTFFGLGLVKTSEDFGVQSEPPVQPELLEWLAAEFRETGWDVKRLHRLIITSATYRQSSVVSAALHERDPENRLFARGARFRLPAMLIRDQALAASGLLVRKMGGKPVYPYQPKDIWDSLAITKERDFTYPQSTGDDLRRRSLYTFWRRTVAPADMFDASARNVCKVRPSLTNTPLHALTTLNAPIYLEAARSLAANIIRIAGTEPERRIAFAFRRLLARWPDADEARLLRASLDKQLARFRTEPKAAAAFLGTATTLDPAEHAAYSAVCIGILNLDETLTKE